MRANIEEKTKQEPLLNRLLYFKVNELIVIQKMSTIWTASTNQGLSFSILEQEKNSSHKYIIYHSFDKIFIIVFLFATSSVLSQRRLFYNTPMYQCTFLYRIVCIVRV